MLASKGCQRDQLSKTGTVATLLKVRRLLQPLHRQHIAAKASFLRLRMHLQTCRTPTLIVFVPAPTSVWLVTVLYDSQAAA